MRDLVCTKCEKKQPVSLDRASRVAVTCIQCGTRLRAVTNKNGRLSIEEMEAGEDMAFVAQNSNLKSTGG